MGNYDLVPAGAILHASRLTLQRDRDTRGDGVTFRAVPGTPAFAVLVMGAANQRGEGIRNIYILGGMQAMQVKWSKVVRESPLPHTGVNIVEAIELPFPFLCPSAPPHWQGLPLRIDHELLASCWSALLSQREQESQCSTSMSFITPSKWSSHSQSIHNTYDKFTR